MTKRLPRTLRLALKNRLTTIGSSAVFLLALIALLAPLIVPFPQDTIETHIEERFQSPSTRHFFGTDELGRDVFSRVLYGTRISLRVGAIAIGLALAIGVPLGVVAGYAGGMLDEVIMRITDVFLSFPPPAVGHGYLFVVGAKSDQRDDRYCHCLVAVVHKAFAQRSNLGARERLRSSS